MKLAFLRIGDEAKYFAKFVGRNTLPVTAFVIGATATMFLGSALIAAYPPRLVLTKK